tara:strand:+ start:189 stop:524 length:336 start_codon:yes stop_codon:yes gene_type:complete
MRAAVIALALLLILPAANANHHASKKLGVVLSCAQGAWLRDGPGVRHKYMKTIKRGSVLPVLKIYERNWLQVVYEGQKGWVHRTMVKWSYQHGPHEYRRDASCSDPLPQET